MFTMRRTQYGAAGSKRGKVHKGITRRWLTILLALTLGLSLVTACQSEDTQPTETTSEQETETTVDETLDNDSTDETTADTGDPSETEETSEDPGETDETDETDATEPVNDERPRPSLPDDPVVNEFFGPLPEPSQIAAFERNELRAIYIGAAANVEEALEIARKTEVNAVVLDLKESDGIKYHSQVPLAVETGLVKPAFNITEVIERFHAEDVKVIGRIVCFKNPLLAEARPDLAIQDANGNKLYFSNEGGKPFVNPYNQTVWQLNIDVAVEAIELGVDEIQYDYVRFPTGGTTTGAKPYFGEEGAIPNRVQTINRFLQVSSVYIQDELGIPLGADVFGIIITSELDGNNLGQDWQTVGLAGIDSVSPMIYPSHYANNSTSHYSGNGRGTTINGVHFEKPDLHPYDVMYNAVVAGREATEQPGYAVNRPYLQAFTASYLPQGYYIEYGPDEIRAQIHAIYDAGYKEWICWNAQARYPISAFDPD